MGRRKASSIEMCERLQRHHAVDHKPILPGSWYNLGGHPEHPRPPPLITSCVWLHPQFPGGIPNFKAVILAQLPKLRPAPPCAAPSAPFPLMTPRRDRGRLHGVGQVCAQQPFRNTFWHCFSPQGLGSKSGEGQGCEALIKVSGVGWN